MKKKTILFPKHQRIFAQLGENIRLARLRRRLSAEMVAERAGVSRVTLHKIEQGTPSVAMGSYFMVLHVLGLEQGFMELASDDPFGRRLQDLDLKTRQRAPKRGSGT